MVSPVSVLSHLHFRSDGRVPRASERVRAGSLLRIRPGINLEREVLDDLESPWDLNEAIALARLFSVVHNAQWLAFGESAAMFHGLPQVKRPQDIHVLTPGPVGGRMVGFEPVPIPGGPVIPGARIVRHHMPSLCGATTFESRAPSVDLPTALVSTALTSPAPSAFVTTCMGLRAMTGGGPARNPATLAAQESARGQLLGLLDSVPSRVRGRGRAHVVLGHADGGCESVGEAALLWILLVAGVVGLQTQMPVSHLAGVYYIDIGIPGLLLALEFDGRAKYSEGSRGWQQRLTEKERQRFLEGQGFVVLRYTWNDLARPSAILAEIEHRLRQVGRELVFDDSALARWNTW